MNCIGLSVEMGLNVQEEIWDISVMCSKHFR
jgi:hypothetical protein